MMQYRAASTVPMSNLDRTEHMGVTDAASPVVFPQFPVAVEPAIKNEGKDEEALRAS